MTDFPIIGRRGALAGTATLLTAPAWAQGTPPAAPSASGAAITVDRARTDPIPIGIPTMGGDLGAQITGVITNDLQRCGLFKPLTGQQPGDAPDFTPWKAQGAQALVTGNASSGRVEFRLWDVPQGQQIQGTAYTTAAGNWRRVAHIIADVIYERLLGEKGYFDTRIVYVAGSGPRDRRVKRLAIMDQDSENNRYLTDGSWLVLTPRFHPTLDEIVFMSYANNRPRVYSFNLGSGSQRVLGEFEGITFAPRFAPDGSHVIMSVTRGAGSDIVTVGLNGGGSQRLTNSGAIDTSPCYSPDGSQIVFNSDRGGDQQLYLMGAGGGGAKRISFGKGRYATPVWSPRGDLIAFTRLGDSGFGIGVMHPDGSGERILSESFDVEGPTFCPNGRVLMFFRESAAHDSRGNGYGSRLVSIDITGFNERAVSTPGDASDPAWSPLLA
jgi:TolB protein